MKNSFPRRGKILNFIKYSKTKVRKVAQRS